MKRILLLIAFLLFGYSLVSAQDSYYHIEFIGEIGKAGCGSSKGLEYVKINYSDGSQEYLFNYEDYGTRIRSSELYYDKKLRKNKRVTSIYIRSKHQKRKWGDCKKDHYFDETEWVSDPGCFYLYRDKNTEVNAFGKSGGWYEIVITPKIKLPNPSIAYLPSNSPINIGVPKTNVDDSFFNWQYSINGGTTWRNLPKKFQNDNYISIKGDDFLSEKHHGKTVDFRVNTRCHKSMSNVVSYQFLISAPHIISSSVTQTTCYDTNDGEITVRLDRSLKSGEQLNASLTNVDNGTNAGTVKVTNNSFTFKGLKAGRYRIDLLGFYKGFNTYTDGPKHSKTVRVRKPTPVKFSITNYTDVRCYGEDNGTIAIKASGGTNRAYQYQILGSDDESWQSFDSRYTTVVTDLPPGVYEIRVRDGNECIAKKIRRDGSGNIIGLGKVKVIKQTIKEPLPLESNLVMEEMKDPTAYGFTNGVISVKVKGGNHNNTGYTVKWKRDGTLVNNAIIEQDPGEEGGEFASTIRLLNGEAGTYTAIVTDSEGCSVSIENIVLEQPERLSLTIEETNAISCNNANTDDEFDIMDGELTARARGGVRLDAGNNGGKFYYYTWYKRNPNGDWGILESEKDSVLSDLNQGEYAVNIKDGNGIVIGEYESNALKSPVPVQYGLKEPDSIAISIGKENVFCYGGNNAWIEASVSGGTLKNEDAYAYEWEHDGEIVGTTAKIENLYAGTYILTVTDSNGCFEIESVTIDEPAEELQLSFITHKQPKATGLTDGYIQYRITGGTAKSDKTYNYQWTDAAGNNLNAQVTDSLGTDSYYIKLNNIGKGTYSLTVTDANYSKTGSNTGCTASDVYTLDEPDPLELTVEETKVISCNALNEYGNPYADGQLTAHAKGGVRLQPTENGGLPYKYTWKKQNPDGTWQVLTDQTDSIAVNLDAGEYAVNIKDANGVVLGNYGSDNELEEAIDTLYTLEEPPLLEISTTQQNVYCYAGSDAWAEVSITGGTAPYAIEWSNGATDTVTFPDTTSKATELSAGTYEVHVIDDRGCEAIAQVLITEPQAPVAISYPQYNRPTSIGATDAWIEAEVIGGTPFDNGTYTYFWKNEEGTLLNAQTSAEVVNGIYVIRLTDIPAGNYYLTVQDENYEIATTKLGCTHANSEFVIDEPIEAIINVETPISCNTDNEYQDPFSDGALVAHINGGVPFESGLPYIYHWKKQNENGQWEDLTDQLDSIAIDLNDGNYALNVEDSKGTVMGTYASDDLIKAIDSTFYFKEPDLLEISFTTSEISCDAGNDGSAKVHITGGTPPYTIKWSNGETTPEVKNLIGGTYFVFITDSRGCEVSGNVEVAQPGGIQFDVIAQKDPTCFEGSDGKIDVNVSGGLPPYEYQWNTGANTNSISNLSEGRYTLRVIDGQDCIAYKEVVLEDPEPVYIDLGKDRTLCNGQEFSLDITIDDPEATYQWESDKGFTSTSPQITLNKAGIYTATITTALGCVGQDQIEVKASSAAIDADFLITSQAFVDEEVVLVNVSSPLGEGTEWHVPDGVTIISESNEAIILKFKEKGAYEVRLRTVEGDCYQDYTKQIVVEEPTELYDIGEAEQPFLKKFLVHPNPNDGNFTVEIELSETADVALRLISLLTADVSDTRNMINSDSYSESYSMALASGTYVLLLETPKGNEVRRVIIR